MRYKVGWFIPQQVLALTHFVPEVTQDDFMAIIQESSAHLQQVTQPFHLIIDNRLIKSEQIVPLEVILQSIPQLQQVPLRWVLMILPMTLRDKPVNLEVQQSGDVRLRVVDSLSTAFEILKTSDTHLNWQAQIADFFPEDDANPI